MWDAEPDHSRKPIDAISPEVRGAIAAIGIVKGKPFAPDERMKKLLTKGAGGQGRQLAADRAGQELVHHAAHVRPS